MSIYFRNVLFCVLLMLLVNFRLVNDRFLYGIVIFIYIYNSY